MQPNKYYLVEEYLSERHPDLPEDTVMENSPLLLLNEWRGVVDERLIYSLVQLCLVNL